MNKPIVIVTTTEALDDESRAAIIRLCVTAHNEPDFENLFRYIPAGGLHFLAYDGGTLASHAVVTTRFAQPDDLPLLRVAYVDAVATLPAYQGRGYSSALLRRFPTALADFDIACLETQIVGFYERLGWQEWHGPLAGRKGGELIPTPDQKGIMVLRLPGTPEINPDAGLVIECDGDRIW